jgi:hypothetical protein
LGRVYFPHLRCPGRGWVILQDEKGVGVYADGAALKQVGPLPELLEVAVGVALVFPLLKELVQPAREEERGGVAGGGL